MTENAPRLGQVRVVGDRATLSFERYLPHPPMEVWKAITDPNALSKWYMSTIKIDGRVGGTIDYSDRASHVTGSILEWDPPRVFEHEWIVDRAGSPKGGYGVIRWELRPEGNGTLLRLVHRNLPGQFARNFAPGTHAILDRLEAHLNHTSMPDWMERQEELRKTYVP